MQQVLEVCLRIERLSFLFEKVLIGRLEIAQANVQGRLEIAQANVQRRSGDITKKEQWLRPGKGDDYVEYLVGSRCTI